jgi:hypothetical protein
METRRGSDERPYLLVWAGILERRLNRSVKKAKGRRFVQLNLAVRNDGPSVKGY